MGAPTEHSADYLAALALSDPAAFVIAFVKLLPGQKDDDIGGEEAAKALNEHAYYSEPDEVNGILVKCVDEEGGGEGGGESVVRVYEVSQGGKHVTFIRSTGCYYSHDGTYWDESFSTVYPHEVMVTQYHDQPQEKAAS